MTAILKAEGVVVPMPKQPTALRLESWKPLMTKIEKLDKEGVNLTDHVAIAVKARVDKRAKFMKGEAKSENSAMAEN